MKVKLLPHQWEFLNSTNKFVALVGGVGSGKTWTLAQYLINRVSKYPKALHFVGANTYSQLRDSTLAGVFSVLKDLGIEYRFNQSSSMLTFLGGRVLCKSMDNYDSLRGIQVGSFILDEARDMAKEAFDMMIGRLRDPNVNGDLQGRVVTSPSGFNWIYHYFHESGTQKTNMHRLIRCSSQSNRHLPPGYLDALKTQYDEKFYSQEVMGEFLSLASNRAYYAFDSEKHVQEFTRFNVPFWTFCDFNVDPFTGGALQYVNGRFYVYDERFLRDSDTFRFMDSMQDYWGTSIIPDSTGSARSTKSLSDHQILSQKFKVIYSHNPHQIDRVNNLNRLFKENRIIIHKRCVKLIEDLMQVTWDQNNKLDQKTNRLLTHISDGLGYACYYLDPVTDVRVRANIEFL